MLIRLQQFTHIMHCPGSAGIRLLGIVRGMMTVLGELG